MSGEPKGKRAEVGGSACKQSRSNVAILRDVCRILFIIIRECRTESRAAADRERLLQ